MNFQTPKNYSDKNLKWNWNLVSTNSIESVKNSRLCTSVLSNLVVCTWGGIPVWKSWTVVDWRGSGSFGDTKANNRRRRWRTRPVHLPLRERAARSTTTTIDGPGHSKCGRGRRSGATCLVACQHKRSSEPRETARRSRRLGWRVGAGSSRRLETIRQSIAKENSSKPKTDNNNNNINIKVSYNRQLLENYNNCITDNNVETRTQQPTNQPTQTG